jgi:hypothetical protein
MTGVIIVLKGFNVVILKLPLETIKGSLSATGVARIILRPMALRARHYLTSRSVGNDATI